MVGFPVSMVWGKRSIEVSEFVLAGPEDDDEASLDDSVSPSMDNGSCTGSRRFFCS